MKIHKFLKKNFNTILFFIIVILSYGIYKYLYNNYEQFQNNIYTAVIIEPRKHKALHFVLKNYLENLDNNWNILILHGNLNKEYIINIINNKLSIYKNRITLKSLNKDNVTWEEYSTLLATPPLYDLIPSEVFLIFQTDSMIIPRNKNNINDFIKYDYSGGPWKMPDNSEWGFTNGHVGNGGLSLRRKSKMLEIINTCPYKGYDLAKRNTEDIYFSLLCPKVKTNKPSFEKAKKFASDSILDKNSFGIHKCWQYHSIEDVLKIFPEAEELYKLQGVEE